MSGSQLLHRKKLVFAVLVYALILFFAYRQAYSLSGWLVIGVAPVLWLDRYVFRLIPWGSTRSLRLALAVRLGIFLATAVLFYRLGIRMVILREAVYLGFVVSMSLFLVELSLDLAT